MVRDSNDNRFFGHIPGSDGDDSIDDGAGPDHMEGGSASDFLLAGPTVGGGIDTLAVSAGNDIVLPWHRRSQPRVRFTFEQLRDVKIEQKLPRPFAPMEDIEACAVVYWADSRGMERSDDVLSSAHEYDCRLPVEWITSKIALSSQVHNSPNVPRPSGRTSAYSCQPIPVKRILA